jgi:hypothetical protein
MFFRRFFLYSLIGLSSIVAHAEISKGDRILIERGFQVQGLATTGDTFHLSTLSNANYTAVHWLWSPPRSFDGSMPLLGAAPGFPWARWVGDETDMPPKGDETAYTNQLVMLQLSDEPNLDDPAVRTRFVNWFDSVRSNWPNTILYVNDGGGLQDGNLIDFVNRARPDMISFDNYPWKSTYDTNQADHIGVPIGGPPLTWYSLLRIHRDISRAYNIPYCSYVQTFHAVEEYGPHNVYRDPSPSELRLNHFGALAFGAKALIDFHYNNGSSSLFTTPGGDSNPKPLFNEKSDCARRCRNFGKALVRLRSIDEATWEWTTSVMFLRGKDSAGSPNGIPINFVGDGASPDNYTDWVYQRNDPYLNGWTVTNKGTVNNSFRGDVIISWFKPLDESFDGSSFSNQIYMMVVNGLTSPGGTAADCLQEIKLNFVGLTGAMTNLIMLDPTTGNLQTNGLPLVSSKRQLVLNLNGGDAVLFKFNTGAPFVGFYPPQPAKLNLQRQNGTSSISIEGTAAAHYQVEATSSLPATNWSILTNVSLPSSSYLFEDTTASNISKRFYRAVAQ